ncbi:putative quinol monooxygenase [Nitratireductor luteus]|uniref:putative quinol monooxygenase n=1 Tax=Nitratireductor luteus TaxID=2976980 RepID=UPI00223F54FB|nr:antibiotic biosynthesis monooxygenase [Nitratireductor luteus]
MDAAQGASWLAFAEIKEIMVIREIARFVIKPEETDAFASAAQSCIPMFRAARGFRSFSLEQSVEVENVFYLFVEWEALEDHTVHFRKSAGYQQWRSRVGHLFFEEPQVCHMKVVHESA